MTPRERAEAYARVFPKYPKLRYDDRWIDGFWVLGNNYKGSGLHGSYPPGYLKRIRALFPDKFKGKVLHLFSGELPDIVVGFRLDISKKRDPPPDVYGDAQRLPFATASLDLIVADPPYTPADAKKYGTVMINRRAVLAECARVLKPGGILIWLDTRQPMHRKIEWNWFGVIGLARSGNHLYRAVTFYQRLERNETTMASVKARIKSAMEKFVAGMAILIGEDEATVSEALAAQISNTKTREGKDDDAEPAKRGRGRPKKSAADDDDDDEAPAKKKGPKPPAKDDDDEDDDEDAAKKKKKKAAAADDDDDDDEDDDVPAIPSDAKLEAMERKALKVLAGAHDIEFQGLNREDLTKALQEKRDGAAKGKKKPAAKPAEDDDDDEAAPKKKKKAAAADDDDDDDEEAAPKKKKKKPADDAVEPPDDDDYPKTKVMKGDLEAFFKLNKQPLKDTGFFGGKPKKGVAKAEHTYEEIMGDVALIKEAWADNVWPEIQGGTWDKQKAAADDMDDEDDDE